MTIQITVEVYCKDGSAPLAEDAKRALERHLNAHELWWRDPSLARDVYADVEVLSTEVTSP